ncbi:hypothetical protein SAMD00019534_085440 [Acytostelium subglobosum LB1]|uniref:hypothetical protein n=1 Tax=Acytostelium subglobosum LB1 TaxID=1410327 RepID=UPI00064486C9|nr:hypothetical protein SAMD00019534_085440 [Acytostelium subglobosum LB1]GAM25369.1 hypothetical protein SAMD00019534_085440 [Acytostelium subglobosum LB1]|eukprot:XP_012751889.1 hypothetical protein SAMD00019534_085440 [Acytostelium subglobosum LB1]
MAMNPTNANAYLLYGSFLMERYPHDPSKEQDIRNCFMQLIKLDPRSNHALAVIVDLYINKKLDITTLMDVLYNRLILLPQDGNTWKLCADILFVGSVHKKSKLFHTSPTLIDSWSLYSKKRFLTLFNATSDALTSVYPRLAYKLLIYYLITKGGPYVQELINYMEPFNVALMETELTSKFNIKLSDLGVVASSQLSATQRDIQAQIGSIYDP